jgi:hypothetical protein
LREFRINLESDGIIFTFLQYQNRNQVIQKKKITKRNQF